MATNEERALLSAIMSKTIETMNTPGGPSEKQRVAVMIAQMMMKTAKGRKTIKQVLDRDKELKEQIKKYSIRKHK